MLCYYEWYDTIAEECGFEEAGCIFWALLHYDRYGGAVALPSFIEEKLLSDKALKILFVLCMDKVAAASKQWINKHKLKSTNNDAEDNDSDSKNNEQTKTLEVLINEEMPF